MIQYCIDCNNGLLYDSDESACYYICIICNNYICDSCVNICNNCGFKFCGECMTMKSITINNQTIKFCVLECYELFISDLKTCNKCCLKFDEINKTTGFCEDCSENITQITYLQETPVDIQNVISNFVYNYKND